MIKEFFSKLGRRKQQSQSSVLSGDLSTLDRSAKPGSEHPDSSVVPLRSSSVVTKKRDNVEVFNEAVEKLIDKLENINNNLTSQVQQNEQLVERINTLPEMLSGVPKAVVEQREAFAQVAEQLRQKVARDEKVAEELSGIHEKVAEAAEVDAKMCDSFGTFSETLSKLDSDTVTQTKWLEHMNRTFTAGERYLKYAIEKQQSRFYWVFGISLAICLVAIAAMVVSIIFLKGV